MEQNKQQAAEAACEQAECVHNEAEQTEQAPVSREAELEKQLSELEDRYKRMLAEYDNFRKRSAKEREGIYKDAFVTAVGRLLPVLDNLDRAAMQPCQDAEYLKGVGMIARQFYDILEKDGIKPMGEPGEEFNPTLHNAILHVEDENFGENQVCEVLMRGFAMGDRIVRHAMVKVAN